MCFLALTTTSALAQLTEVVSGLQFPYGLALNGNDLYISEYNGNRIIKLDITDPLPPMTEVVVATNRPAPLALRGDELFLGDFTAGSISKVNITDAVPMTTLVTTGVSQPNGMTIDGDILYVSARGTNQILSIDVTEPNPTPQVVASISGPVGIVKFGESLYVSSSNGIRRIDLSQSPATSTFVASVPSATGLTLNGNFLYIAGSGAVSRIDLNAETPMVETVVSGLSNPGLVAFNGITMFIAEIGNNRVVKLELSTPALSEFSAVCLGDMPTMLGGATPTGGVYAGPGVTDNGDGSTFSFDPMAAGGVGEYTITYNLGGSVASSTLSVVAAPTVTFSTGDLSVQVDAGVQTGLSGGMPAGGVYSGNGVTDDGNGMTYSFDPAAAGEGENVITYTFTDANGCGGEQGAVITVTPATVAGDLCADAIDVSSLFGGAFNVPQVSSLYDNTPFVNSTGDPAGGFECFYGGDGLQNSGWFSFTGDGNTYRMRNVQCTGPNDNLDLQVVIYSGDCGSLVAGACNDDNPAGGTLTFSVEFETEVGVEYVALVDGYDGTTGEFCLEVTNLTDPTLPGEQCDIAIDINSLFGQAEMVPQSSETFDNYAAYDTDDTDIIPSCLFSLIPGTGTIWFSFTGDGNRYTINSANNSNAANPLVGVAYTGTCGMLTEIDCQYASGVTNFSIDLQTEDGVEYTIMVAEDFANATASFNLEVTNLGTVGVQNIQETAIQLYPNPTTGFFKLEGVDASRVLVFDQLGRQVAQFNQPAQQMDIQALPAGVYALRIENTDGQVYSARIVKE